MKKNFDQKYYLRSSTRHGWGEKNAQLDQERVALLKKYVVGKNVLDIGCGYGLYVDFLAKKGFSATGVDFTPEFITKAKKKRQGKFLVAQAEKLPFADKTFDTVFLFDILEHGDDKKVLAEAKRVSKQAILIIVPRVVDEELELSGVIFRHYLDKSHLREYQPEDIKKLAKGLKLKVLGIRPVHNLYNATIFAALFGGPLLYKKIIRRVVLTLLPLRKYPTEYFAVLER